MDKNQFCYSGVWHDAIVSKGIVDVPIYIFSEKASAIELPYRLGIQKNWFGYLKSSWRVAINMYTHTVHA
jgi:hypothetical protein